MQMICICSKSIMKKIGCLMLVSLLGSGLASCGSNIEASHTIYTSFFPIYDLTSRIVGDKYKVSMILPQGLEPHSYEISAKKVVELVDSKAIFINGLDMEYWYEQLPDSAKSKTVNLSSNIETIKINGIRDPHIWLNPNNAIKEMEIVTSYLCEIDKSNSGYYQDNFETNKKIFLDLDKSIKESFEGLRTNKIVVSHAAFGYFAKEYGLEQIYVKGLEPNEEPSAKVIEGIIETIKENNITTIFSEELGENEISKLISEETGAKIETLSTLEMSVNNKDYIALLKENASKIKEANK